MRGAACADAKKSDRVRVREKKVYWREEGMGEEQRKRERERERERETKRDREKESDREREIAGHQEESRW